MNDLIQILILLLQIHQSPIGRCDPANGPKLEWTDAERLAARRMANTSVRERGASPIFISFLNAATTRETHGAASRWHDGGAGLGMHGVNIKVHAKRWPTPLNPAVCDPRVSAAIVQDISHDCITRHGASNPWELQACYAGRFECTANYRGKKICTGEMQDRTYEAVCGRMAKDGFGCWDRLELEDLGRRMPREEREKY